MNLTVKESVRTLQPIYGGLTDAQVISEIRTGCNAGDALFYLIFGRYQDMLHSLFVQEATSAIEFSDFMLELNMRLYNQGLAAIQKFDEKKASFKTYLSKIAHNLLYDLRKKERPTIDCPIEILDYPDDDGLMVMQLIDAINSYADKDARYVLFKVIEGYKSKEIALMLSSRRHEEGTLDESETLKPSYIDTMRSRALRNILKQMLAGEGKRHEAHPCAFSDAAPCTGAIIDLAVCDFKETAVVCDFVNPFIENICNLLTEVL